MTGPIRLIGTCLQTAGTPAFALHLLELAQQTGARQVMVFDLAGDGARCLMSRNYARHGVGEALAQLYLDGWYRKDPLGPALHRLAPGQSRLVRIDTATARMPQAYRQLFFLDPGLSGKTAVLIAGRVRRLIVNLYEDAAPIDGDLAALIAHLIVLHFDRIAESAEPPALAALSARERAVCLGILNGHKTEAIAAGMGLSPDTVATYRKRAYHKLGISSRGALFAICQAGAA